MATLEELSRALKNADAAGDVDAAQKLARAITVLQSAPQEPASPSLSWQETAQDVGDAFGNTLTRAVTAIPGTPGTLRDVAIAGENYLFPDAAANRAKAGAEMPDWIPASEDIFGWLPTMQETTPEGLNYQPKSPLGQEVQDVTDFAGNLLMPGGWIKKGAAVLGPYLATKTAGKVAHQFLPEWEPQIRAGTAIVATIVTGMGAKSIKELSTAQKKQVAKDLFAQADANGETIAPEVFEEILSRTGLAGYEVGLRPHRTPKSYASLKYADEYSGKEVPVRELQKVRELLQNSGDAAERTASSAMRREFDKALDENAINVHADARKAWADFKRAETVDKLRAKIDRKAAKFSLSGKENATRDVYRTLADNENRMRYFDQATTDAINRVATGGPVENAARLGGKFAPTGPIPTMAAFTAADWPTAIGIMAPGAVSRLIATGLTSRNRRLAEALMKHGGEEGLRLFREAKDQRSRELLARAILGGEAALTTTANRE